MKRIFPTLFLFCTPLAWASHVEVHRADGRWGLLVDSAPFFIKGVGCNQAKGEKGEDYLLMAKGMGANAVRTWGGAPRTYLDQAQAYGLKVNLGIWLNPVRAKSRESYLSKEQCRRFKESALDYVRAMKNHPALLLWNVGNEVFAFTENPQERQAFGEFLEDLIQAIHKEDPEHPVVYASAGTKDLPYLKQYVPSLDMVGVNTYGGFSVALGWVRKNGWEKPVIATEFGPAGSWDTAKDRNHLPYDPFDHLKAADYASLWRQVEAGDGQTLGGFAFVLGEQRNQDSLTWWNINWGDRPRDAYWQLRELYTGKKPDHKGPKFSQIHLEKSTDLAPNERFVVEAQVFEPEGEPLHYSYLITDIAADPLLLIPPKLYPAEAEELTSGKARLKAPGEPGAFRVYVIVEDPHRNVAIADRSLTVRP